MNVTITNLDTHPYSREPKDIPDFVSGHKQAEALTPNRKKLYDIYAGVENDGHVTAVVGKRIDAVTGANWQFVDVDGKPVDEVNKMINTDGFYDILAEIILSKFWGYSMMEPKFYKSFDDSWQIAANEVPKLHMRPELGIIATHIFGDEGINVRKGIYAKTVMEVGKPKDLGLYLKAAPYAILKRGGIGDYAMFVQTFGMPIIDAIWDGFDQTHRKQLNDAIATVGGNGSFVRPSGTEVNFLDKKSNANGELQTKFVDVLNKEISKALLGTTETVESSSSSGYAQAKTHEGQDNNKHESDTNFVQRILNSRFRKILITHGFDDALNGSFIIQGEETELTKKESFEIHKELDKMGLPISDDFFYDTYGVPKPDNYDQLVAEKRAKAEATQKQPEPEPTDPKPTKKKKAKKKTLGNEEEKDVELSWFGKLLNIFAPRQKDDRVKLNDPEAFDSGALLQRIADSNGTLEFDQELHIHTAGILLRGFKDGWDTDNAREDESVQLADYASTDPAMTEAFERNIFRFSASKTLSEVQMLNEMFRASGSFQEFYNLAIKQTDVFNKTWMETEFTTSLLTGESAATYQRLMSKVDLFPFWEYRTVGDEHVRKEHMLIHGLILPATDPRWDQIFPPNGWLCRCFVLPRLANDVDESKQAQMSTRADNFIKSPAFQKAKASGWGVNRGKTTEVFTEDQLYNFQKPAKSSNLLGYLKVAYLLLGTSTVLKDSTEEDEDFYQGLL